MEQWIGDIYLLWDKFNRLNVDRTPPLELKYAHIEMRINPHNQQREYRTVAVNFANEIPLQTFIYKRALGDILDNFEEVLYYGTMD